MTIIRGAGPGDAVVVILQAAAQDSRLSFRARGILVSVMSRPKDWRTGYRQLAEEAREGERAVLQALRELERLGYLRRARIHNGRHLITAWEMSDDPGRGRLLLQPTSQQPTKVQRVQQQPTKVQPPRQQRTKQQPAQQQPDRLQPIPKGETKGETPPPTPSEQVSLIEAIAGLVVVVRKAIDGKAAAPSARGLDQECARLAELGWKADQLKAATEAHDWSGARAGAVVTWLRRLEAPPTARKPGLERPAWCGRCDEPTRTVEGPSRGIRGGHPTAAPCPDCHPAAHKPPADSGRVNREE